jgi:hypothetical protein
MTMKERLGASLNVSTSHDRGDGAMGVGDIYHSKSDVQTTTTCVLNFFCTLSLVQQFISTNFNWCEGVSSVEGGSSRCDCHGS